MWGHKIPIKLNKLSSNPIQIVIQDRELIEIILPIKAKIIQKYLNNLNIRF